MFMNIFSEKEGHGEIQINQQDLVCGGEVRVESRTSGSTGHRKVSRGCAYSCVWFLTGRKKLRPYIADINKVSVYHCKMPANPALPRDYAKQGQRARASKMNFSKGPEYAKSETGEALLTVIYQRVYLYHPSAWQRPAKNHLKQRYLEHIS
jgi:hypothetical protein